MMQTLENENDGIIKLYNSVVAFAISMNNRYLQDVAKFSSPSDLTLLPRFELSKSWRSNFVSEFQQTRYISRNYLNDSSIKDFLCS